MTLTAHPLDATTDLLERLPRLGATDGGALRLSFEFFPPKTEKMETVLWESVERLAPLGPRFVSVTYGAGGSTRQRTHDIVRRIQGQTGIPAAAHLTCVEATRDEIDAIARNFWEAGIRHIVALRGDPPGGIGGAYTPHPDGYRYADDLVAGLRRVAPFEISVSAYPEVHPQAPSAAFDLDHLRRKAAAGATRAITQFFFDAERFLRFRDLVADAGIALEIVPGILPVSNFEKTCTMARACGASLPDWFCREFEGLDADPVTRQIVAAAVATDLCRRLYAEGVREFHFYTLNRHELVAGICHLMGVRRRG